MLEFDINLNNSDVLCPHCGGATTVRAIHIPRKAASIDPKPNQLGTFYGIGCIVSIFLPLFGFIIGLVMLISGNTKNGATCMLISVISAIVWTIILVAIS